MEKTPTPTVEFDGLHLWRSYDKSLKGTLSIKTSDGSGVKLALPESSMESLVRLMADELAAAATFQAAELRAAILGEKQVGCAACDRGNYQLGHHHDCPKDSKH